MIASIAMASQTATKIDYFYVFPICSRWALDGRIFSQSHGTTLSTHLQSAMLMYNDTLGTDTSNPEDLVEESGIRRLESKYVTIRIQYNLITSEKQTPHYNRYSGMDCINFHCIIISTPEM